MKGRYNEKHTAQMKQAVNKLPVSNSSENFLQYERMIEL